MMSSPISLGRFYQSLFWLALSVTTLMALWPMQASFVSTGWDKSNHVLGFFVLAGLLDCGWLRQWSLRRKVAILLAYGMLIELVQAGLVYRTFSLWDWFSDGLGILVYGLFRPVLLGLRPVAARLPLVGPEKHGGDDRP